MNEKKTYRETLLSEIQDSFAKHIQKEIDAALLAFMSDEYVASCLSGPYGNELIGCLMDFELGTSSACRETPTKLAIDEFKKQMQIPLEDVPVHLNDPYPINNLMKWRLKASQ